MRVVRSAPQPQATAEQCAQQAVCEPRACMRMAQQVAEEGQALMAQSHDAPGRMHMFTRSNYALGAERALKHPLRACKQLEALCRHLAVEQAKGGVSG